MTRSCPVHRRRGEHTTSRCRRLPRPIRRNRRCRPRSRRSGRRRCRRYSCRRRRTSPPLADAAGKTPLSVAVAVATAVDAGAPSAPLADAAGKTSLPVTVAAAGATAAAAASTTVPPPHVGTSPTKGARDGGYGPVESMKTRYRGLPDLTFVFLGTARLIAFASPQPSPDAVTMLACGCMGMDLRVVERSDGDDRTLHKLRSSPQTAVARHRCWPNVRTFRIANICV